MKKVILILLLCTFFGIFSSFCQSLSINTDGSIADSSAILDVKSTSKGILVPRMTLSQKNSITTPATGLLVYQTDNTSGFYFFNGTTWLLLLSTSTINNSTTLVYTTRGF